MYDFHLSGIHVHKWYIDYMYSHIGKTLYFVEINVYI